MANYLARVATNGAHTQSAARPPAGGPPRLPVFGATPLVHNVEQTLALSASRAVPIAAARSAESHAVAARSNQSAAVVTPAPTPGSGSPSHIAQTTAAPAVPALPVAVAAPTVIRAPKLLRPTLTDQDHLAAMPSPNARQIAPPEPSESGAGVVDQVDQQQISMPTPGVSVGETQSTAVRSPESIKQKRTDSDQSTAMREVAPVAGEVAQQTRSKVPSITRTSNAPVRAGVAPVPAPAHTHVDLPNQSKIQNPKSSLTIGQIDVQVQVRPPTVPPRPPAPTPVSASDGLAQRYLDRFELRI